MEKIEEIFRLLSSKDSNFNKNVIEMRRAWVDTGMKEGGFDCKQEAVDWLKNIYQDKYLWKLFNFEIINLYEIAKLNYNFAESIANYVLLNNFVHPSEERLIFFDEDEDVLQIDLRADTTEEDVLEAFKIIKSMRLREKLSDNRPKFRPIKDLDLLEDVYYKHKEGWSYKKLADYISSEKHIYSEEYVRDLVRKYKKYADIIT